MISFPPRNEPNAFFQDLTALYRDELRRSQNSPTYVDPEGENVWLTEYFRFYLNGCSHAEAVARTLSEISPGGSQPVCGSETPAFPPRNLPNEFQGFLEAVYRDVLRRPQTMAYVDSEGANVWLAEYLRYRLSACDHFSAETRVFTQIRGGGVQPTCSSPPVVITGTVSALGESRNLWTPSGSGARQIRLTWNSSSVDLDLIVTSTSCSSLYAASCQWLASSRGLTGTSEQVTFQAQSGVSYYLWADSWSLVSSGYTITVTSVAGFDGADDATSRLSEGIETGQVKPASAVKPTIR